MFAAHEVVATAHADGPALSVAVAAQDDSPTAMVAAQGDSPTATVAAQDDGLQAAVTLPQKKKKIRYQGRKSLSMNALVKEINKDSNVTKKAARTVLDALAKIGLRELESCGVFTVPDLANLKVTCVEANPARKTNLRMSRRGHLYIEKQRPGGKRVMADPARKLKRSINAECKFKISRSIDATSPPAIEESVCSDIGQ